MAPKSAPCILLVIRDERLVALFLFYSHKMIKTSLYRAIFLLKIFLCLYEHTNFNNKNKQLFFTIYLESTSWYSFFFSNSAFANGQSGIIFLPSSLAASTIFATNFPAIPRPLYSFSTNVWSIIQSLSELEYVLSPIFFYPSYATALLFSGSCTIFII